MKSQQELLSRLRVQIGKPSPDQVQNAELMDVLESGLDWAAERWRHVIHTDTLSLELTAGQLEYDLPDDVLQLIWLEWNGTRLKPDGVYRWDRDGIDWRGSPSGSPASYALQGRSIILNPPPTAAAVATDSVISYRYVASAPDLGPNGVSSFGDADLSLVVYHAALEWLGFHPGEDEVTIARRAAMAAANEKRLNERLADADRRHRNGIADFRPGANVFSRRQGATR